MKPKKIYLILLLSCTAALLMPSCADRKVKTPAAIPRHQHRSLPAMGYTIQAGAFARVENAVRLTEKLKSQELDATYFKASD